MTTHMNFDRDRIPPADDREAGLAKWAQERMARLRYLAESAQRIARDARLATDPVGSQALLDYFGDTPIGLGRWPEVYYVMPGKSERDRRYISVKHSRQDPERLMIHGSEAILFRPQSTNLITVEIARDYR